MKLLNIKDSWEIPEFLKELNSCLGETNHLTVVPFSVSGDDTYWIVASEHPLQMGVTQELFDELLGEYDRAHGTPE